jgi:hypothetical protein
VGGHQYPPGSNTTLVLTPQASQPFSFSESQVHLFQNLEEGVVSYKQEEIEHVVEKIPTQGSGILTRKKSQQ